MKKLTFSWKHQCIVFKFLSVFNRQKLFFECLTMVWSNFGRWLCVFLLLSMGASVNINRHCTHLYLQNTANFIVDLVFHFSSPGHWHCWRVWCYDSWCRVCKNCVWNTYRFKPWRFYNKGENFMLWWWFLAKALKRITEEEVWSSALFFP